MMYMKKSLIFFLILILIIFMQNNKYSAKVNTCSFVKEYNKLSTNNMDSYFKGEKIKDIKKICTNKICTYNLDNNIISLKNRHTKNVLDKIINDELKIKLSLKGVKINAIYFDCCI